MSFYTTLCYTLFVAYTTTASIPPMKIHYHDKYNRIYGKLNATNTLQNTLQNDFRSEHIPFKWTENMITLFKEGNALTTRLRTHYLNPKHVVTPKDFGENENNTQVLKYVIDQFIQKPLQTHLQTMATHLNKTHQNLNPKRPNVNFTKNLLDL